MRTELWIMRNMGRWYRMVLREDGRLELNISHGPPDSEMEAWTVVWIE